VVVRDAQLAQCLKSDDKAAFRHDRELRFYLPFEGRTLQSIKTDIKNKCGPWKEFLKG
jgi:hypothetical protein